MIDFGLTVKGAFVDGALAKSRANSTIVMNALIERMTALMAKLEEYIKENKLSGQVLSVESGTLQSSIRAMPVEVTGDQIVGNVLQDVTEAPYGPVQELGGLDSYTIAPIYQRAGTRHIGRGDKGVLHFLMGGKDSFARYVLHPPLTPRSYMVSALEDMRAEIEEGLREAIFGATIE